jgi:hypothetical protein
VKYCTVEVGRECWCSAILTESSLVGARHDWLTLVSAISQAVAEPLDIDGNKLAVSASIGVTTDSDQSRSPVTSSVS